MATQTVIAQGTVLQERANRRSARAALALALCLGALAAPIPAVAAVPTDPSTGSEDASSRYDSAIAAEHRAGERDSAESDSAASDPGASQPAEDASTHYDGADSAERRAAAENDAERDSAESDSAASDPDSANRAPKPCDPDFVGPVGIGSCSEAELAALRQRDRDALVVQNPRLQWMQVAAARSCLVQGGGVILGPGGQQYAVITRDDEAPRVERTGSRTQPLSISVPDDGVTGTEVEGPRGFVEVGDPIPFSAKAAPALIGLTGGGEVPEPISIVQDPEGGRASIVETRAVGRNGYPALLPVAYNPPPDDGQPPANAKVAGGQAVGLVNGFLAGVDRGQSMDNERLWEYQVIYYKGYSGSRRARLKMRQQRLDAEGNSYETVAVGSIGADGKIVVGPSTTWRVQDLYEAVVLPSRRK